MYYSFAELQATVSPITSKIYGAGAGGSSSDDEPLRDHDEL